jgi:hypothetical protein
MFDSTLLPQTNDPQEMQKAILDLLDKINQISGSSSQAIATFSTSATVPSGQKYIPINTDSAVTLNILNTYDLYDEIEVHRISSGLTTNAVTLVFNGETMYGAKTISLFGNSVAKTTKFSECFRLRKITVNTWELVYGEDAGANANGGYVNRYDKKTYQDGVKNQSLACTGTGAGALFYSPAYSVALPYTYKDGTVPVNTFYVKNSSGSQIIGASGTNDTTSTIYYMAWRYASATETRDVLWTSQGYWI